MFCFFSLNSYALPFSFLLSTPTVRVGPIPSFLLPPISSFFFFFFAAAFGFWFCRTKEWVSSFDFWLLRYLDFYLPLDSSLDLLKTYDLFESLKNEGLEVVENPPNSSPSFLKKLLNKVIELLSLSLLYSPSFFKLSNRS